MNSNVSTREGDEKEFVKSDLSYSDLSRCRIQS